MKALSQQAIVRGDTLAEQVRAALRKLLIEGAFAPGERIKIRDVAAALSVSPTPAREALMHLIAEGALLADTNKTASVPELTIENLSEITDLRISLETLAAAAATTKLTKDDLTELERCDREGASAFVAGNMKAATERNAAFHFKIYNRSGMPLVTRMVETTWLRSGSYLAIAYDAFAMSRKEVDRHGAILSALKKRDEDAVRTAVEEDIRASARLLSESLKRHLVDGKLLARVG